MTDQDESPERVPEVNVRTNTATGVSESQDSINVGHQSKVSGDGAKRVEGSRSKGNVRGDAINADLETDEVKKSKRDSIGSVNADDRPVDAEPGEVSDDDEEAAVNVIVKDRPSLPLEGGRSSITANHLSDAPASGSGNASQAGQELLTSINSSSISNVPVTNAPTAIAVKTGTKTGVDVHDPGNINGVATIDFNIAALSDDDKPWKKPGADITDYFNYGFTEQSWMAYSEQQRILRAQFGGMNIPVATTNISSSNVKVVTQMGGDRGPVFRSGGQLMGRGHDRGGGVGGGAIGVIGSVHRENRRMGGRETSNGIELTSGMSIPTAGGAGAYAPPGQAGGGSGAPPSYHGVPVGRNSGGSANFSVPPPNFHVPPPGLPPTAFLHPAAIAAAVNYGAPPHDLFAVPPPGGPMPPVPWDGGSTAGGPGPHGPGSIMDGRERTPDSIRSEEEAKLAETQAEMLERDMRVEAQRRERGDRGYRSHRDRDRDRDRERDRERDRDRDRERDRVGRSPRPSDRDYGRERGIGRYDRDRDYGRDREHHRTRYRSRSRSRSRDRMRSSGRSKRSRYALEEENRYPPAVTARRHAKRSRRSSRSRSHSPASVVGGRTSGSGHRSSRPPVADSPPIASRRRGGALGGDISSIQDGGDSPDGRGLASNSGVAE